MPRAAAKVSVPGEAQSAHDLTQQSQNQHDFVSDPDAAVEAGRSGKARKIAKPLMVVPQAVLLKPDDTRTDSAPINAKASMSIDQAMSLDRKAKLQRPVMTESGWYCPRNSASEQKARKKNNEEPIVDID